MNAPVESDKSLPGVHIDFSETEYISAIFDGFQAPIPRSTVIDWYRDAERKPLIEDFIFEWLETAARKEKSWRRGWDDNPLDLPMDELDRMRRIAQKIEKKIRRLEHFVSVWTVLST